MNPVKNLAELGARARAMRRTAPTAIIRSGGVQTVFDCVCGDWHTCATDYDGRHSRHVLDWRACHNKTCKPLFVRLLNARAPGWLDRQRDAIYSDDTH